MTAFHFNNVNWEGYVFTEFYPVREGRDDWRVYGRNKEKYGVKEDGAGRYVRICAWLGTARRTRRGEHFIGWRTRREAQEIAAWLNGTAKGA